MESAFARLRNRAAHSAIFLVAAAALAWRLGYCLSAHAKFAGVVLGLSVLRSYVTPSDALAATKSWQHGWSLRRLSSRVKARETRNQAYKIAAVVNLF